jgi:hypothetical protein
MKSKSAPARLFAGTSYVLHIRRQFGFSDNEIEDLLK